MDKEEYRRSRGNLKRTADNQGTDAHKMVAAAELVAIGYSYTQAAKEVGVHANTIRKWSRKTAFRNHVETITSSVYEEIKTRMASTFNRSMDAIHRALDSDDPKLAATIGLGFIKVAASKASHEMLSSSDNEEAWSSERLEAELEFAEKELVKYIESKKNTGFNEEEVIDV